MYVPNYVPEPVEVPGNITEQKYHERLAFIRRVSVLHFISFLVVYGLVNLSLPRISLDRSVIALLTCMVALSLARIVWRAKPVEPWISGALFLPFMGSSALALRALENGPLLLTSTGFGIGCAVAYALLCGRDFSFLGQFFLALIASTVMISGLANYYEWSPELGAKTLIANSIFLCYYVYDLAALLARRRKGEELAAVVDLYRDILNIFGYINRVIHHWRKHRIWAPR